MKSVGVSKLKRNKKGEMGIGTMILFIAMVLVAAVAAALLISTAGNLNQQAQETGRLAESEVASGFGIVEVYGVDCASGSAPASPGTPDNDIDDIYLKIRLTAGSDPIDLDNVIIEVTGQDFEANLVTAASLVAAGTATTFGAEELRDPDSTWSAATPVLSQGCLIKIHIDVEAIDGTGLTSQEEVQIKIIPKHGSSTLEIINVPEALVGNFIPLA